MEWLGELFKNPVGHVFWLAQKRETGQYTLFWDKPPQYEDIARSVAVVKVVVIQKMVVSGPEKEE
jgi:hypothetical protein